ncbi:Yim1p SCDLUD_002709 [Saccharomycodes ludwigii]|uniref:Yim1p n=1 Tax=Saccharomycodes ludwigii TaxID=36035 RepID=UPI001E8A068C|nr:hypothetical protein SCDLUD_002709 [Saccharomycodes ludwigii]KAH3901223.1 hypothetical protein SCDLUD_002709 [Saccharomycodes ludwigii]
MSKETENKQNTEHTSPLVKRRSITFVNNATAPKLTITELNISNCYSADEILIKVHSAAFNPVDILLASFANSWLSARTDKTFGRDFSGEVIKVGSNVQGYDVGDHVCGLFEHLYGTEGTMSDYLILNPTKTKALGKFELSKGSVYTPEVYDKYCSWPLVFGTAFQGLLNYTLTKSIWKEDQSRKILVVGASTSVGTCVVQIAKKYLDISVVDGICSAASFERNKQLGYDTLFDYHSDDLVDQIVANSNKYDVIYDCCGNSYFSQCMDKVLKPKDTGSYYVTIVGDQKMNYKNPKINFVSNLRKLVYCTYNYHVLKLEGSKDFIDVGLDMLSKGELNLPIDSLCEPEEFEKAIDRLESNNAKGKIVVRF